MLVLRLRMLYEEIFQNTNNNIQFIWVYITCISLLLLRIYIGCFFCVRWTERNYRFFCKICPLKNTLIIFVLTQTKVRYQLIPLFFISGTYTMEEK